MGGGRAASPRPRQPAKPTSLLQGVGKKVQEKRKEYANMSLLLEDPPSNEETMVLLLDVSRSMHPYLQTVIEALSSLAQMKMLFHKEDDLGLVLFGASETGNTLNKEMGGYNNVVVSRPLLLINQDLSDTLDHVTPGFGDSDYVSALVVGMDMIVREMALGAHGKNKRLHLITDGETSLRPPFNSTSEAELTNLSNIMKQQGATVDVVIVRMPKKSSIRSRASVENERLLRRFAKRMRGKLAVVENESSLMTALLQNCHVAGTALGVLDAEKKSESDTSQPLSQRAGASSAGSMARWTGR